MANVFFKFWRIGSVILLTAVLLFCYTTLPDDIAVGFSEDGSPVDFITKQTFFYGAVGVIVGVNFLVSLLEGAVKKLNFKQLLRGSSWGQNPGSTVQFMGGWFSALMAFVNTYLVFVLLGLYNINSDKYQMLDFNYNYLLWVGILLLAIILMFLPYKLLVTEAPNED